MGDFILGLLLMGLSIVIYLHARTFPKPLAQPGPGLFPMIVSLLLLSTSGFLVISRIIKGTIPKPDWRRIFRELFSAEARNFLAVNIMVLAYLLLSPHVGFFFSATMLLFCLMMQLKVRPLIALSVALLVATGARLLFQNFLKIPLPPGPLPGGW